MGTLTAGTLVRPPNRFAGVHAHSTFSLGDGFGLPSDHIDFVLSNGMDAWALTDHGSGNGLAHAYVHARKLAAKGVKYRQLYGCEFYFVPSLSDWRVQYESRHAAVGDDLDDAPKIVDEDGEEDVGLVLEDEEATKRIDVDSNEWKRRYHLVVLARDRMGLQNLFTLVKRSYSEGFYRYPRIDFRMLKEHSEGLVVSTACMGGYLSSLALRGDALARPRADIQRDLLNVTDRFVDAVGRDSLFLELQFNRLPGQHVVNDHLLELHDRTGVRLVATADSHYPSPDKWEAREMYRKLSRLGMWRPKPGEESQALSLPAFVDLKAELYPKNAAQMWEEYLVHRDVYPFYAGRDADVAAAIETSHDIAWEMCDGSWIDTSGKLPDLSTPKRAAMGQLIDLVKAGLKRERLDGDPQYVERARRELGDIKLKGFENYFLILQRLMERSGKRVLFGAGRGSGAGSLVNYLLRITDIDPIKYGLLWERFVNVGRASYPDIDSDVSDRDVLIEDAREMFGHDDVVPVSNFNMMKLKSLVKDVSKFYGIPFDEVNAVTGPLQAEVEPHARDEDAEKSTFVLRHEDCMEHSPRYRAFMEKYPDVERMILDLFMQVRSVGRHAGGVLICPNLQKHMPVITVKGEPQTPWTEGVNIRNLEENGFLKYDFLGLATLRMIEGCIRRVLVREGNSAPTFSDVRDFFDRRMRCRKNEPADEETFRHVFQEGRFVGVFQFTSDGARKFCMEAAPSNIEELAAVTAIYRPGPLKANVHMKYVEAKRNAASIRHGHPAIAEVLGSTFGFICFQEQFMILAQKLAGFSPGDSDKMRKTLVKRDISTADKLGGEKAKLREHFIEGAVSFGGMPRQDAEELFEKIAYFSLYGFNKSHAVAYAVDSYYSAWLHTHYETDWLATVLDSAANPDELAVYLSEVRKLGYVIGQVDVNRSGKQWTYDEEAGSFLPPLVSLKGLGGAAADEIIASRPYVDLDSMLFDVDGTWRHSKFNKTAFAALVRAEAFGSLADMRSGRIASNAQLHSVLIGGYDALRRGRRRKQRKGLPELQPTLDTLVLETAGVQEWTRAERIKNLSETCSFVSDGVLFPNGLLQRLTGIAVPAITELPPDARKAMCWFIVTASKVKASKGGKHFHALRVSDSSGGLSSLRIWGASPDRPVEPYSIWMGHVDCDPQWGPSTHMSKVRRIPAAE